MYKWKQTAMQRIVYNRFQVDIKLIGALMEFTLVVVKCLPLDHTGSQRNIGLRMYGLSKLHETVCLVGCWTEFHTKLQYEQ